MMNKKGSATFIIIFLVLILFVAGAIYFYDKTSAPGSVGSYDKISAAYSTSSIPITSTHNTSSASSSLALTAATTGISFVGASSGTGKFVNATSQTQTTQGIWGKVYETGCGQPNPLGDNSNCSAESPLQVRVVLNKVTSVNGYGDPSTWISMGTYSTNQNGVYWIPVTKSGDYFVSSGATGTIGHLTTSMIVFRSGESVHATDMVLMAE